MTQLTLVGNPEPPERVYYATDGCNVKIGRTSSLRRRGGELKVQMLWSAPGGDLEERRHHRMWAKHRIGDSEWFVPADELLLWLVTKLTERGPTRELAQLRALILGNKKARRAA